ncbi:hypothetical protein EQW78_06875 [Oerskovia turbata]|uniref:Uncharacterized protein n=1 Tax=Oerskovia turbata TaxID=1713 RepID=A0A4Q1KXE3_9CELL|nr:hypothetical protein [Oerskovia turbata]RXR24874.1 hypothetical protein EQW73_13705 [Oerskovia turbata]RXR34922.1 hypothetical protein EQW78_06875 [Oerskovia turbata]TGJ96978.1 hypothetical protein DLJ96_02760 [Actinotalea fermentans ATCC 43279 = JCM 9966 = DSM 3133]
MSDLTSRRIPPGPVLDALRTHRYLPDWALDVPQLALEHALVLAEGDPHRLVLDDDGTIRVENSPQP